MKIQDVFDDIARERNRQEELKRAGRFAHSCADDEMTHPNRFVVLGEEFGEVAGAVAQTTGIANDRTTADLRKELLHVAAVAVAWLESFDATP